MRNSVRYVPAHLIDAGDNDREEFDPIKLKEAAESINAAKTPPMPLVRPKEDGRFEIVYGERRVRAMRDILGWDMIPCIVVAMDDETASSMMLAENTNRVNLNPMEEARSYAKRKRKFGWTVEHIAKVAGRNVEHVRDRLALLDLIPEAQHFVQTDALPLHHALAMLSLDANRQRIALKVFNRAKAMPLMRFKEEVIAKLLADQTAERQTPMFELELMMVEAVASDLSTPASGKKARTGAPINRDLPPVRLSNTDNVGAIMDRYIADLLAAGRDAEAAAVGTLHNALVAHNWTTVPVTSPLAKIAETSVTDDLHIERIDKGAKVA